MAAAAVTASPRYAQHRPEGTLLYQHLETFLDEATRAILAVPQTELDVFDPAFGTIAFEMEIPDNDTSVPDATSCFVREARAFSGTCPVGLECTPGGECVAPREFLPEAIVLNPLPQE